MNFRLSEEHEMIRKMVRDFAKNEVAPTAAERDEEERFDKSLFDKMAELGLKLSLTELDVCLGKYQDIGYATDKNKKIQGQFYYDLITGIMERVKAGTVEMNSLTFWGFADELSWRQEYNPLLLDRKWSPKYAYAGALMLKEYAGFDEVTE